MQVVNKVQQQQQLIRGGIYIVNLPNSGGSIQSKQRPCVLVSNNSCNNFSPVLHVCPLSSVTTKKKLPTHIMINRGNSGLLKDSIALCEQVMIINKSSVGIQVGFCSEIDMQRIGKGISIQFGLTDVRNNIV